MDDTIQWLISRALEEDSGPGDPSSAACIPDGETASAEVFSRQSGILSGLAIAEQVFKSCHPDLKIHRLRYDGDVVHPNDVLLEVEGDIRSILRGERVALNFMQRLTGIATTTHKLVRMIQPYGVTLLDTRKTTPGWRVIEKAAVRHGGGTNHRMGLYDAIMLKDNHIDYAGGVKQALEQVHEYLSDKHLDLPVIVEARDMREAHAIIETGGADRILLDNFDPKDLKPAADQLNPHIETEASGGITFDNIESYAATGVHFLSTSIMTQVPGSFDLSMRAR